MTLKHISRLLSEDITFNNGLLYDDEIGRLILEELELIGVLKYKMPDSFIEITQPWIDALNQINEVLFNNKNTRDKGKWHFTIISPKEAQEIRSKIGDSKFNEILKEYDVEITPRILGLGKQVKSGSEAYYFVIDPGSMPDELRKRLSSEAGIELKKQDYHITLGFNPKDVFDVPKDASTIIANIPEDLKALSAV